MDCRRLVVVVGGLLITLLLWAAVATARELLGLGTMFVLADISVWIFGICMIIVIELKAHGNKRSFQRELDAEKATDGFATKGEDGKTILLTKDGIFDI